MWEKYRYFRVNRDHGLVIPRSVSESWFRAGDAFLAPLFLKREILVDESDRLFAWTLYNDHLGTVDWALEPRDYPLLNFPINVYDHPPNGQIFTIPLNIRKRAWLPKAGEKVIVEFGENELNFWTISAYNTEYLRESVG